MQKRVLIIAEAGVNHNGDLAKAKELIQVAKDAGADFVKFQTFKAEKIVSKAAKKAVYQKENTGNEDDSQFAMLKALELSEQAHRMLIDECEKVGIKFLSTAFDLDSIDFLDDLGIPFFKIPSGEITNYPYLKRVAEKGKPVVLSTGMANIDEIGAAIDVLEKFGILRNQITVLHCNTEYPTPMSDVNLLAMHHISKQFGVEVGYSDHTMGIEVSIAAVALGAKVIEKHFTLDKNLPGPDHKASLEPAELKNMISAIRNIELAISGDGIKKPSASEQKNKSIVRKSLHFKRELKGGHIIDLEDFDVLRPATGINPMEIFVYIGKKLAHNVSAGQVARSVDFE